MNIVIFFISFIFIYAIVIINTNIIYIPDSDTLKSLQAIFLSVGSALIGSTAIIFSIILFTLQVNNERVPHDIFIKLSRDKKLFAAFIFTLILSISIATFSLLSAKYALYTIQFAILFLVFILSGFIYSYTRALKLISPIYQLETIVKNANDDLFSWSKKYEKNKNNLSKYDFFLNNPYWADNAKQDIVYCNAYAKKLIEKNDYVTSEKALKSIVEINTTYIKVKNQAFVRRRPFPDPLLSNDKFIEDTLEEIRQNIGDGLSRNDERFITNNFEILKDLHFCYSGKDNGLASFYLIEGVKNSISHNIPDVLLAGIRGLTQVAQKQIIDGGSQTISGMIKIIADLVCYGIIDKKLEPISKDGLHSLAIITIKLLESKENNTSFITKEMNQFLYKIGETEIKFLDSSYFYFENTYYSMFSNELINFTNNLMNENFDDINQQNFIKIIENIEKWSDSIRWENRELFKLALEHNSNFVHQLIDFISNVSRSLMALSTLEIVDKTLSLKLQDNAQGLISIFSLIREDENTINLLEMVYFTDTIFKLAVDSHKYGLTDITHEVRKILLSVGFRGQKVDDQNRILAKALGGSIYINILLEKDCKDLVVLVEKELKKHNLSDDIKTTAINDLQNMLNLYPSRLSIDNSLNSLEDRKGLKNCIDLIVTALKEI
ncbi:MAG: hypothetical protein PHH41_07595 [Sulfurimonas sp.]|nr:hypothetical protein [Sulfurimonas sp.]MDD3060775.1 hypothetical protein [Sulfurimonas sp.]MDD5202985.1 hypothetical protein [Sulfurimonas sp.]